MFLICLVFLFPNNIMADSDSKENIDKEVEEKFNAGESIHIFGFKLEFCGYGIAVGCGAAASDRNIDDIGIALLVERTECVMEFEGSKLCSRGEFFRGFELFIEFQLTNQIIKHIP